MPATFTFNAISPATREFLSSINSEDAPRILRSGGINGLAAWTLDTVRNITGTTDEEIERFFLRFTSAAFLLIGDASGLYQYSDRLNRIIFESNCDRLIGEFANMREAAIAPLTLALSRQLAETLRGVGVAFGIDINVVPNDKQGLAFAVSANRVIASADPESGEVSHPDYQQAGA